MRATYRATAKRLTPARRTVARVWHPIETIGAELGRAGTSVSSLLVLPGLGARLGLRYLVGRIVGTQVAHSGLTYEFGGSIRATPQVIGFRLALILLVPSLLLVAMGVAFGLPIFLEAQLLGVDIIPASMSAEATQRLVVERFVVRGTGSAMQMWCALSAWYAAALSGSELRAALASTSTGGGNPGWQRVLSIALAPFRLLTRVTDPLDRFLGVATGAVSLFIWVLATGMAARVLF